MLVQQDHGPYVAAESVAVAWWYLYHLQKVADVAIAALSTGRKLRTCSPQVKIALWDSEVLPKY